MKIIINKKQFKSFSSWNDLILIVETLLKDSYKEYEYLLKEILNCKSLEFKAEKCYEDSSIYTLVNEYKEVNLWYGSHTVETYCKSSYSASSTEWYWFNWGLDIISSINESYGIQKNNDLPKVGDHWNNIWKIKVFHIFDDYYIYNNQIIKARIF